MWQRIVGATIVAVTTWGLPAIRTHADDSPYQNVWVHYDYMVGPNGESYAPDPAGIQIVVDAFKRHGVILHIDPQHTAIPLRSVIVFDVPGNSVYSFDPACTGPDAVGFSALKAQYFHPTSSHPWHYVIFGKYVQVDSEDNAVTCVLNHDLPPGLYSPNTFGYAELPGYDFLITLGWFHDNASLGVGLCSFFDFQTGGNLPCWPVPAYAWATFFMHELGHNLGLFHGGDGTGCCGEFQTDNYKPNYVSVMNYDYSYAGTPIITASTKTKSGYWYRVDYSDETLPPLDERNLDEPAGIGPTTHPTDYISWCCQFSGFAPATGPIDWNNNGTATDAHVSADLNNDGSLTVLKGFNDWDEVHQYLAAEDTHPKQTRTVIPWPSQLQDEIEIDVCSRQRLRPRLPIAGGGAGSPRRLKKPASYSLSDRCDHKLGHSLTARPSAEPDTWPGRGGLPNLSTVTQSGMKDH